MSDGNLSSRFTTVEPLMGGEGLVSYTVNKVVCFQLLKAGPWPLPNALLLFFGFRALLSDTG